MQNCKAKQYSDQVVCKECDLTWDMNDPCPPNCAPNRLERLEEENPIQDWVCKCCDIEFETTNERSLHEENARLREALESMIDLSILGNDNQGKMALVARQALKRGKG